MDSSFRRWLAVGCLVAYAGFLVAAGSLGNWAFVSSQSLWSLQEDAGLVAFLKVVAISLALDFALAIPFGVLFGIWCSIKQADVGYQSISELRYTAADVAESPSPVRRKIAGNVQARSLLSRFAIATAKTLGLIFLLLLFVAGLICVVSLIHARNLAWHAKANSIILGQLHLLPAALGAIVGAATGWILAGGWKRVAWSAIPVIAVLIGTLWGALWLIDTSTSTQPIDFRPAKVTSDGKRRLVKLVKESKIDKQRRRLVLSAQDVNFLLSWGLSVGSENRKAHVKMDSDATELFVSIGLPLPRLGKRFINVHVRGQGNIIDGEMEFRVHQIQIGQVALPRFCLSLLPACADLAQRVDQDARDAIAGIRRLEITKNQVVLETDAVTATDGSQRRTADIIRSLLDRLRDGSNTELKAIEAYLNNLARTTLPPNGTAQDNSRILTILRTTFALATVRSQRNDPIRENRAALLALGIALGHHRVQTLVGRVMDSNLQREIKRVAPTEIRGRRDWTQHYFVSAALAMISSKLLSDTVGLLKEELDADGGSGFSFADLLADRAGTRLAIACTRNAILARKTQNKLASISDLSQIFPQASDLPENLPDLEFQKRFGGVTGAEYKKLLREIDHRISGCPVLNLQNLK